MYRRAPLLLAIFTVVLWMADAMAIEETKYRVLEQEGSFEIREYAEEVHQGWKPRVGSLQCTLHAMVHAQKRGPDTIGEAGQIRHERFTRFHLVDTR